MMKKNNMAQNKRNGKTDGKLNFIRRKKQQAKKKLIQEQKKWKTFPLTYTHFPSFSFYSCFFLLFKISVK